jgi:hypothetical protein
MRELLYISDAKLERFVNDRRVVPSELLLDVQLSIANLLNVKIANSKGTAAWSSARVMKKVEKDTKLSFAITQNLFLAWCSGPDEPDTISGDVTALPDTVLLLHGSARHVIGSAEFRERQARAQSRIDRIGGAGSGSEPPFIHFVQKELEPFIGHDGTGRRQSFLRRIGRTIRPRSRDPIGSAYGYMVYLSERFELDNLTGFARVTGLFDTDIVNWEDDREVVRRRIISASPLYVERVASGPSRY